LWRRRTNVGAFDAQGSLLVHPMVCEPSFCMVSANVIPLRPGWTKDFSVGPRVPNEARVHGQNLIRTAPNPVASTLRIHLITKMSEIMTISWDSCTLMKQPRPKASCVPKALAAHTPICNNCECRKRVRRTELRVSR
jgi:hypothetical protein